MSVGRGVPRSIGRAVGRAVNAVWGSSPHSPNWVDFNGDTVLANTSVSGLADATDVTVFFRLRQTAADMSGQSTSPGNYFIDFDAGTNVAHDRKLQIMTAGADDQIRVLSSDGDSYYLATSLTNNLTADTDQDIRIHINSVTGAVTVQRNDETPASHPNTGGDPIDLSAVTRIGIGGESDATDQMSGQMADICVYDADVPMSSFRASDGSPLLPPTENALVHLTGNAVTLNAGSNAGTAGTLTPVNGFVSNYPFAAPINWIYMDGESLAITDATGLSNIAGSGDPTNMTLIAWLEPTATWGAADEFAIYAEGASSLVIRLYRSAHETMTAIFRDAAGATIGSEANAGFSDSVKHCVVVHLESGVQTRMYVDAVLATPSVPSTSNAVGISAIDVGVGILGRFNGGNQLPANLGGIHIYDYIIPIEQIYNKKSTSTGVGDGTYMETLPSNALLSTDRYTADLLDRNNSNATGSWDAPFDTVTNEVFGVINTGSSMGFPTIIDLDETPVVNATLTEAVVTNPYSGVTWTTEDSTYYRHRSSMHDHFSKDANAAGVAAHEEDVATSYDIDVEHDFTPFMHYSGGTSSYPRIEPTDAGSATDNGDAWKSLHEPVEDWVDYDTPGTSAWIGALTNLTFFNGGEWRIDGTHILRHFCNNHIEENTDYTDPATLVSASKADGAFTSVAHPWSGIEDYSSLGADAVGIHNGHYYYNTRYYGSFGSIRLDLQEYTNMLLNWNRLLHKSSSIRAVAGNDRYGANAFGATGSIRLAADSFDTLDQSPATDSGKIEAFSSTDDATGFEAAVRSGAFVAVIDTEALATYAETAPWKNNYPQIDGITQTATDVTISTVDVGDVTTWYVGNTGTAGRRFAYAKIVNAAGTGTIYTQAFLIA